MEYKSITQYPDIMKDIKKSYKEAFPRKEQVPLFFLKMRAHSKCSDFGGLYDGDAYVGLIDVIYYKDIVFIFYLATAESLRGKGYGSRILQGITKRFPKRRIVLNMEKLDEHAENYEQQLRRKAFYNRNGFLECGVRSMENGVAYEMMAYGDAVPYEEFAEMMKAYMGTLLFHIFYKAIKE